jgi:hypothetical protein
MKKIIYVFIVAFTTSSCLTTYNSIKESSYPNLVLDLEEVSENKSYIFGRFYGTFNHSLGLYIESLETENEIYISFINNPLSERIPDFPKTQEGYQQRQEYIQRKNITVIEVIPGSYKIVAVQLANEKRYLDQKSYNPNFNVNIGEIVYIGDWSGMEAGANTIMINDISNKYKYTSDGLLLNNSLFASLDFKNSLIN